MVEAAARIVEADGVGALTMRRLADALGAAVTAIYWHVGNRDALLDLLVDRLLVEMGDVPVSGHRPATRIAAIARAWRAKLLDHPQLVGLAHERRKTAVMFQPMQAALARELAAVGLRGRAAALAVRAVQCHVVAAVVLERTASRGPVREMTDPAAWPQAPDDPALVAELAVPPDFDAVFELGLDALLTRLTEPPPPAGGRQWSGRMAV